MIDPARIHHWATTCQALFDEVEATVQADASLGNLTHSLLSGDVSSFEAQVRVNAALDVARERVFEAQLAFEAAISRTPPRP